MLRITVFAFLALAVLACSRPEPDSVTQLRWLETADPITDAENALALGDYRVRAVDGHAEAIPMAVFVGLVVIGLTRSGWFVAMGLFGHALFDFIHKQVIENAGVPLWWLGFCLAIDFNPRRVPVILFASFTKAGECALTMRCGERRRGAMGANC